MFVAAVLVNLAVFASFAQILPAGAMAPKADGVLSPSEYPAVKTGAGMSLGVALSNDEKTLYLAVQAPTAGWVALGVGSLRMDGAFMVLAFDANGAQTVSEQTGKGHGHSPNATKKLISAAVKEANGMTTLEIALPSAGYTAGDAVKLIFAYGGADNLNSMHRGFSSAEVPF